MPDEPPSSPQQTSRQGWWARLFRGRGSEAADRREIIDFLTECRTRNRLAGDEFAMLQGVLDVSKTHVREIMVPRSHMVVLPQDESLDTLLRIIIDSGHSRFPVIGEDRDEVVGILLAKDLLRHVGDSNRDFEIQELLRPAIYIPESKRLNTLLAEFKASHNHIAIVVDEYGGVAGLATIEDVLEQIVGDIDDEHDPEEAEQIQPQDGGGHVVRAVTRIEDFNEYFRVELRDEEYETVGGLVMHQLGRLPRRGEHLEYGGFRFRILRGDRRRIDSIEVMRLDSPSGLGTS